MVRPRINTPIEPQTKIKEVLTRPNVQRSLLWLSKQTNINHTLLHQIVNGKRRLQEYQADKIFHTLQRFNIEVTRDEVFIWSTLNLIITYNMRYSTYHEPSQVNQE